MKLKPCPFCGGEARLGWFSEEDIPYAVYCLDGCCVHKAYETETEAIEAWNRREPMGKVVEQLEEKLKEPRYQHDGEDYYVGIIDAIEIVKGGANNGVT